MHPAFSVIFFTTLTGAGYGLLLWTGVSIVTTYLQGERMHGVTPMLWSALLIAVLVLVTIGLLSSLLHLGKPGRAWRSFSQWRTSWLSREGVMAVLTYLPILAFLGMVGYGWLYEPTRDPLHTLLTPLLAVAMVSCALATVVCTAMIYASLKPIPAWQHRLVVPAYLAFAVLTGGTLLLAVLAATGLDESTLRAYALLLAVAALATAGIKLGYWRDIDRTALPLTRGDAVGLPGREISVFERPHTDDNYLTREMGFVVARKHARKLRAIALVLFGVVPMLAAGAVLLLPAIAPLAFVLAAVAALAGAFVERWLFFAEARHLVTLYY
ncbi:MAG: dimethyl sulfoxide reductase anchor subunit [Pseudomonadota bacterium]|nr:dimethyl sulfoxide reductase anchor subunit [Pseudomonadota bacterium]